MWGHSQTENGRKSPFTASLCFAVTRNRSLAHSIARYNVGYIYTHLLVAYSPLASAAGPFTVRKIQFTALLRFTLTGHRSLAQSIARYNAGHTYTHLLVACSPLASGEETFTERKIPFTVSRRLRMRNFSVGIWELSGETVSLSYLQVAGNNFKQAK